MGQGSPGAKLDGRARGFGTTSFPPQCGSYIVNDNFHFYPGSSGCSVTARVGTEHGPIVTLVDGCSMKPASPTNLRSPREEFMH